jgi:hypothetical protein
MGQWTSGCACGAIRYACEGEPTLMFNCHCRDCQRASGSAYAAITIFPKTAIAVTGEPRWFAVAGGSGQRIERGFCAACGSPVGVTLEKMPQILGLPAASLDDPALFMPQMDLFTASAHPWDAMDPERPKKPRGMRD